MSNEHDKWTHGGLERSSINILRLISELEGVYQLTKYMAYDDDNAIITCLLYTSPSPRDRTRSRMPSSA